MESYQKSCGGLEITPCTYLCSSLPDHHHLLIKRSRIQVDSVHSRQAMELLRRKKLYPTSRESTDPCTVHRLGSRFASLATSRKFDSSDASSQQSDSLLLPHDKARDNAGEGSHHSLWPDQQYHVGERLEPSLRPKVRRNLFVESTFATDALVFPR